MRFEQKLKEYNNIGFTHLFFKEEHADLAQESRIIFIETDISYVRPYCKIETFI